tara:strand:+ start:43 stop:1011 length:969 start_codon:yes stop_codon:yes gene_type:complete
MAGTSAYPTALDDNTNLNENLADNVDTVAAAHQNNQNKAIKQIQSKLGITATTATSGKILVGGSSAGTSEWQAVSGDASLASTGAITITDNSHAHNATTLTGLGNHKVLYTNGSGAAVELGLGAAGTVLTGNGVTAAPTFAAPAGGGAWNLEAADTTERGFTNSSDAELFDITGLNIAAAKPLKIFAQIYGTVAQAAWTSSPTFYVRGFNGTQIASFGPQFLADGGKTYLWQFELTWGPRETVSGREYGYINMALGSSQRDTGNPSGAFGAGSSGSSRVQAQPSNSSVPTTSAITSIEFGTIGYSTDQFYCKNVFVYSLAVS